MERDHLERMTLRLRQGASPRRSARTIALLAIVVTFSSCVSGIDPDNGTTLGNDESLATVGYLWGGMRTAIEAAREPATDTFSIALSHQLPCLRGGTGAYAGTLSGTKVAGTGSATVAATAALTACQFDDNVTITTITAASVIFTGTIAVVSDLWGATNVRLVGTSVYVNGKPCLGGVNMIITSNSPSAQPIATGTVCGRTGAVPLP